MPHDLQALERLYRANVLSNREIARMYDMSEANLRRVAKKHGWQRNLSAEIREATQAVLVRQEVPATEAQPEPLTDEEIVAHGAKVRAGVIETHREGVRKAREVVRLLLGQLEEATTNTHEIEEAILAAEPGDSAASRKRQDAMLQAVSLASRAGVADKLASALDKLIRLERQAYNIDDSDAAQETYEDRLRRLVDEGS